jgi:energy-coupling factor transporter ATP-binding protein EcfA2
MFSHKFINYFNLNVQKKSCDDLDVNNIFEKSVSDPVDVKPETTEEKTKRLLEARREIHGCWSMLFMDGKLPSMDVNTLPEFKDLYGIDMQIKMMLTSIIAAYQTNGKRKAHTVLFGPAGCGKTTVLDKLDDLLGKENVVRLDAPCMTKSGLETLLLEMKHIPAVIIIEEIEKCSENNLRTLLGIMDERSEICKTTVSGSVTRSVNSLIFATVNDIEKFNKYLDGALSSRFKNKVFFPRPSEQTLNMILERDISKNGGKKEWVKPVLDFAKELNVTDPRMILSWLINGDRLLDGSFQKDYREMERLRMESGYAS